MSSFLLVNLQSLNKNKYIYFFKGTFHLNFYNSAKHLCCKPSLAFMLSSQLQRACIAASYKAVRKADEEIPQALSAIHGGYNWPAHATNRAPP